LQKCEEKDTDSLKKLVFAIWANENKADYADALDYVGSLCLEADCYEAFLPIVNYSLENYLCLDLGLSAAERLIKLDKYKDTITPQARKLQILTLIPKVESGASKDFLKELYNKTAAEYKKEKYFISCAIKEAAGEPLPIFDEANDIEKIISVLEKYPFVNWREFWLRIAYEHCIKYFSSDFSKIADAAIKLCFDRKYSKNANIYSLSWLLYKKNSKHLTVEDERFLGSLLNTCRFEGFEFCEEDTEQINRIMRLSVYERDEECRKTATQDYLLGNVISHQKNRYSLTATLCDHSKRTKSHYWEVKVSFPLGNEKHLPAFHNLKVDIINHKVTRNGVQIDSDPKKTCQLLCSSEIKIGEIRHPFTLDFIADIAYVCGVKCQSVELKIKNQSKINGHLVMTWGLFFV